MDASLPAAPGLLDDRTPPDVREVFGRLLARSVGLDVALRRIRLSALDLTDPELTGVRRIRLLLAELNAVAMDAEAHAALARPDRGRSLRALLQLLERGSIEVRSAPLGGWEPDFSIFRGPDGPTGALVGPHWFERPWPHRGPALTALLGGRDAARAARRFEDTWKGAHDVGEAVGAILARAERRTGVPGRTADTGKTLPPQHFRADRRGVVAP